MCKTDHIRSNAADQNQFATSVVLIEQSVELTNVVNLVPSDNFKINIRRLNGICVS